MIVWSFPHISRAPERKKWQRMIGGTIGRSGFRPNFIDNSGWSILRTNKDERDCEKCGRQFHSDSPYLLKQLRSEEQHLCLRAQILSLQLRAFWS